MNLSTNRFSTTLRTFPAQHEKLMLTVLFLSIRMLQQ